MALTGGLLTVTLGVLDGRILAIPHRDFDVRGKNLGKDGCFLKSLL